MSQPAQPVRPARGSASQLGWLRKLAQLGHIGLLRRISSLDWPLLVGQLESELDTNLSRREQLSLAAAVIASPLPVRITQVPLAKREDNQILRQVKPDQTLPLWPQN